MLLGWGRETIWLLVVVVMVGEVRGLSGSNVCMVQQKYNITKRVKYRAPMSVRSYVWCFSIPPRCSMWKTEMRDLTKLETEERNAEVAVCCPGYKMKDISCIPICPNGKTGRGCTEDCPPNKWGPNCVHECKKCRNGFCSPITGECDCLEGWQGESCQTRMSTTPATTALAEELLTTTKSSTQTLASIKPIETTSKSTTPISSTTNFVTQSIATSSKVTTMKPVVSTTTTKATTALSTTTSSTSSLTTASNTYTNVTLPLQPSLWTKSESTTVFPKTFIKTYVYNRTEMPELEPKEPEHITAVMTDKEREHTSVDLVSVVSIAGGVMMAVITVAVVIVMVERCRRPRYDDVRKMDEMRMQSMIDSDDEPPPYVRSIFHTPLPEPPSEKCHYQPITTLDRNLKQFMRPVVVQTISPVMLENFRGILECHYDHLPRRQHDFDVPLRSSITPSTNYSDELRPLSVTDTIEALKCEAKFDVIDSTTSEPLYAEIPCWRPPSEHAIEVNLNGEAVTEL
ncbi:uncharacterized protein LOC121727456 isoform X3 [Aricia agestis]|uniref:uncharacterized protein LOC121727456 isoform X3 n=1 Tax=Aricia agestis TaxID=91739 RepID=UPI001C2069FC|nr:uncharacterized protein LOC121727456 isoform X3 [Aricia agestis]